MVTQLQEHTNDPKCIPGLLTLEFNVSEKLRPYKDQIVKDFYDSHKNNEGEGYSREVKVKEVYEIIKPLWLELINHHFHPIPEPRGHFQIWAYIQNDSNNRSVWHNHTEAEINTVFYLDAPEEGGELEILHVDPEGAIFTTKKIKVTDNKLYCMPFWTYHRPHSQKDKKERVCFNIQYKCKDRQRLKQINGLRW